MLTGYCYSATLLLLLYVIVFSENSVCAELTGYCYSATCRAAIHKHAHKPMSEDEDWGGFSFCLFVCSFVCLLLSLLSWLLVVVVVIDNVTHGSVQCSSEVLAFINKPTKTLGWTWLKDKKGCGYFQCFCFYCHLILFVLQTVYFPWHCYCILC